MKSPPVSGAKEGLLKLKEMGYECVAVVAPVESLLAQYSLTNLPV